MSGSHHHHRAVIRMPTLTVVDAHEVDFIDAWHFDVDDSRSGPEAVASATPPLPAPAPRVTEAHVIRQAAGARQSDQPAFLSPVHVVSMAQPSGPVTRDELVEMRRELAAAADTIQTALRMIDRALYAKRTA